MTDSLAPLFVDRNARLSVLPDEQRMAFEAVEKQSGDPMFADRQFASIWMSKRTGLPQEEVLKNFDGLAARYFGEGVTPAQAYDRISSLYQPKAEAGQGEGGESGAQAKESAFSVGGTVIAKDMLGSIPGGASRMGYDTLGGFYANLAAATGVTLKRPEDDPQLQELSAELSRYEFESDMLDPMAPLLSMSMPFRRGAQAGNRQRSPEEWALVASEDKTALPKRREAIKAEIVAIRERVQAENMAALEAAAGTFRKGYSDNARKIAETMYDLSKESVGAFGVRAEFQETAVGQFVATAGSLPVTALMATLGPVLGGGAMYAGIYGQVEQERMEVEGDAYDPTAAWLENAASAGPQAAMEFAFGMERVMGKIINMTPKVGGKIAFGDAARLMAKTGLVAGTEEAITEPAQGFWNDWVASITYDEGRELMSEEVLKQRLLESASAFALGFAFGGGIQGLNIVDRNRAADKAERFLLTREGAPFEGPDFAALRAVKTDEELRAMATEGLGDTLVAAANGDVAAQKAYRQETLSKAFVDTDGLNAHGITIGKVKDGVAFRLPNGVVFTYDEKNPEMVEWYRTLQREAVAKNEATQATIDEMQRRFGNLLEVEKREAPVKLSELRKKGVITGEQQADALAAAADINEALGADAMDAVVMGSAKLTRSETDGLLRMVINVAQGAEPTVAIEEVAESWYKKAVEEGRNDPMALRAYREQWHKDNGEADPVASGRVTAERADVEWFSKRVIEYALANRKTELPGGWGDWLRTLGERLKKLLRGATRMKKMLREGKITPELEGWFREALGAGQAEMSAEAFRKLTPTEKTEAAQDALRQSAAGLSMLNEDLRAEMESWIQAAEGNREAAPAMTDLDEEMAQTVMDEDTFPKIMKEPDGYVIMEPNGNGIGRAATMEEAQDKAMGWWYAQEQAAEREQAKEEAGQVKGEELMDVVRRLGGLLAASKEGTLAGELRAVAENMSTFDRLRTFRKDGMDLDRLREALAERGFNFGTPAEMLEAMERSTRGTPVYGAGEGGVSFSLAEVNAALDALVRDDLEDDQVFSRQLPSQDAPDLNYVQTVGGTLRGTEVYVRGDVREYGPHEFFFYNMKGDAIGFARLTKGPKEASISMIAFKEESRGEGRAKAFYKYLLDDLGVALKSDKEITEGTARVYQSLLSEGYAGRVDSGRVILEPKKAGAGGVSFSLKPIDEFIKDSVVVNADGTPKEVFHGSPDIRGILKEGFQPRMRGDVFFFTDQKAVAETYADDRRAFDYQAAEPHVVTAFLSLKNPLRVDAKGARWRDTEKYIEEARAAGHDGIEIRNTRDEYNDMGKGRMSTVYAVFSPQQIRSSAKSPYFSRVDRQSLGMPQTFSLAPVEGKPSDRIDFDRLNELGLTNDFREAGYMTPEGKLIDLSGKREGGQRGTRSYDHREAGGTSGMMQLQNMGFIRMQPESGGLDMVQKPTYAQEGVIKRYVEQYNGAVLLDLQEGIGEWRGVEMGYSGAKRRTYLEFPEGTKPVKVLGMIRRFYAGEDVQGMTFSLAQTETPAFKAWFKGSKVVDAQGKPLVVFSGQPRGTTEFDSSQRSEFPRGVMFATDDREVAAKYAGSHPDERGRVIRVSYEDYGSEVDYSDEHIARIEAEGGADIWNKSADEIDAVARKVIPESELPIQRIPGRTGYSTERKGQTLRLWMKMENPWHLSDFDAKAWKNAILEDAQYDSDSGDSREEALAEALGLQRSDYGDGWEIEGRNADLSDLEEIMRIKWGQRNGSGDYLQNALDDSPSGMALVMFPDAGELIIDKQGYDGFIFEDTEMGGTTYVPFESEQVKSLGNRGTFDPANPDITMSLEDLTFAATGIPQNQTQAMQQQGAKFAARQASMFPYPYHRISSQPTQAKVSLGGHEAGLMGRMLLPVSERLRYIADKAGTRTGILYRTRRYYAEKGTNLKRYSDEVTPLMRGIAKMSTQDMKVFKAAASNQDAAMRNQVLAKYGLQGAWAQYEAARDSLRAEMIAAGIEVGDIGEYFPRWVKDVTGLRESFGMKASDGPLEQAMIEAEKSAGRPLRDDEVNAILDGAVRGVAYGAKGGAAPSNTKQRKIATIADTQLDFYADPNLALSRWLNQSTEAIARYRFFGKAAQPSVTFPSQIDLDVSIGQILREEVAAGNLDPKAQMEVKAMLDGLFDYHGRTNAWIRGFMDLSYWATMGKLSSSLAQITDVMVSVYEAGPWNTGMAFTEAMWRNAKNLPGIGNSKTLSEAVANFTKGKDWLTREQLGIDRIMAEFDDQRYTTIALNEVFTVTGLNYMDGLGKDTLLNAKFRQLTKQAKRSAGLSASNRKMIEQIFGKAKAAQVIADFRAGTKNADTVFAVYNVLADWQPISLLEYPETYAKNPNARVLYMLKSYSIKMLAGYRREGFMKMWYGSPEEKMEGARNLAYLLAMLFMAGATKDWLVDFMLDRDPQMEDVVLDNVFKLAQVSRYSIWQQRNRAAELGIYGGVDATARIAQNTRQILTDMIAPPTVLIERPAKDVAAWAKAQAEYEPWTFWESESVQFIPVAGEFLYWLGPTGQAKIERRRELRERDENR
jgi:hypothetical protein